MAADQMMGMVATTFPMSSGRSCSDPTISRRRSSAIAMMEIVETKIEVACSSPIIRQPNCKNKAESYERVRSHG